MEYIEKQKVKTIPNEGYILANKFYHTVFPKGNKCICNNGIKNIDNKDWEMFYVTEEAKDFYYCNIVEGVGLINCMVLKSDTRKFLPEEIENIQKSIFKMGNLKFKIKIEEVKPKVEGDL